MHEYLFDHVDIVPENIHIPDGTVPMEKVAEYCERYEKLIDLAGGIDIQLLGIGRTGHIGFNEPGAWETSPTRMVRLDHLTRHDATKDFQGEDDVPYRAITMGVGSIFKARTVYLMAWGQHKAHIIQQAIEGDISTSVPASFLQKHPNTRVLDKSAAEELTKMKSPWLAGICNWTEDLICKAVIWLSQKTGKPILKLTDEDYNEHGLSDLIIEQANSYELNIRIFNRLQRTITGWPGGKPNADDTNRPERAKPAKKRVIMFSPHPDDDVISMGGTFQRLVDQGHEVHVAYQTSGNIAVHDYDALALRRVHAGIWRNQGHPDRRDPQTLPENHPVFAQKGSGEADIPEVRSIKGPDPARRSARRRPFYGAGRRPHPLPGYAFLRNRRDAQKAAWRSRYPDCGRT